MGHGLVQVFSKSVSSGVTLSSSYDLGRAFTRVYLEVPTMASSDIFIQASTDNVTFRRVMLEKVNTTTAHVTFSIASAISQRMVPIPAGFRYYKVETSSGTTDVVTTYNLIPSD